MKMKKIYIKRFAILTLFMIIVFLTYKIYDLNMKIRNIESKFYKFQNDDLIREHISHISDEEVKNTIFLIDSIKVKLINQIPKSSLLDDEYPEYCFLVGYDCGKEIISHLENLYKKHPEHFAFLKEDYEIDKEFWYDNVFENTDILSAIIELNKINSRLILLGMRFPSNPG